MRLGMNGRRTATLTHTLAIAALIATLATPTAGQAGVGAPWDSVARILKSQGALTSGYYRYNFPRRDITLRVGDVTVATALALGSWAGFSGDGTNATLMGDLVLLAGELKPVLAELAEQRIAVTAIHNHLAGESPQVTYVHFHADGDAVDLAARLDRVLARSATPRPVVAAAAAPVTIDTALVFGTLGIRGRAQGNVAQVSTVVVTGAVTMHGRVLNPALAYGTPINIQLVSATRAIATGDFSVLGSRVDAVTRALAANGITTTAVHSHLADEQPPIRYIHFWADGPLADVVRGLRAALDASAPPPAAPAPAGGRGGPPVQGAEADIPLVARFDRNNDNRLNYPERAAAREYLAAHPELRRPARGNRVNRTGTPGETLTPRDVRQYANSVPLYDSGALRTFFLEFEHPDWEDELEAFYHTDVEVGATLIVDGKTYRDVGVSFRGNNSFTAVPKGLKRPLSISVDVVHDQHLLGHRSLNLLNANQDPTFLRTPLYLDIAREYIPALKANFVRVVINGESWGIYVNQQTFSTEFVLETFRTTAGTRWKSPNNSVGGGLAYLGDDVALYRRWYEIKGNDNMDAWRALIHATKVLNETPPERLAAALAPLMDVDEVLRYLALDVALVNGDGYWRDGSDFNLYLTPQGRLVVLPHDANEGLRAGGRGGAAQPEPMAAVDDPNKALRHKLLSVPALRTQYLKYVGDIAEQWLDWNRLGPMVEKYETLIGPDVARDTRKLDATDAFASGIHGPRDGSPASATTIRGFAALRRAALLAHPDVVAARAR